MSSTSEKVTRKDIVVVMTVLLVIFVGLPLLFWGIEAVRAQSAYLKLQKKMPAYIESHLTEMREEANLIASFTSTAKVVRSGMVSSCDAISRDFEKTFEGFRLNWNYDHSCTFWKETDVGLLSTTHPNGNRELPDIAPLKRSDDMLPISVTKKDGSIKTLVLVKKAPVIVLEFNIVSAH